MALSRDVATRIVAAVAADTKCREAIEGKPPGPVEGAAGFVAGVWARKQALRFANLAGAARNAEMLLNPFVGSVNDPKVAEKLCIGISSRTVAAIHAAMKAGRLPEVASCSSTHRVHWGVHHDATWIRMKDDDSEYVFDWHATLTVEDPAISRAADWEKATGAVNYVFFRGWS